MGWYGDWQVSTWLGHQVFRIKWEVRWGVIGQQGGITRPARGRRGLGLTSVRLISRWVCDLNGGSKTRHRQSALCNHYLPNHAGLLAELNCFRKFERQQTFGTRMPLSYLFFSTWMWSHKTLFSVSLQSLRNCYYIYYQLGMLLAAWSPTLGSGRSYNLLWRP